MGYIISLIVIGFVLILAEILLIPGVGVAGIFGLGALGGSCFVAFHQLGNLAGATVTGIVAVLLIVLLVVVLRAKTWKRMTLETNIDSKAVADEDASISVGEPGRTLTRLAPSGNARFGNRVCEVRALEGMIEPDMDVEVVMIEEHKIYVRLK